MPEGIGFRGYKILSNEMYPNSENSLLSIKIYPILFEMTSYCPQSHQSSYINRYLSKLKLLCTSYTMYKVLGEWLHGHSSSTSRELNLCALNLQVTSEDLDQEVSQGIRSLG